MNIKSLATHWLTAAVLCFYCLSALGATVYKSVDDDGVVSFSDSPPEGDPDAESFQIATPPPQDAEEAQRRLDDMRETTDRMADDRREREKHRAQMREIQGDNQWQQQQAPPSYDSGYADYYPPIYTSSSRSIRRRNYYGSAPWRPDYRPRPEHPIARPPIRPGIDHRPRVQPDSNINRGSNSQLMRPMVSPRR
jgi:TolA-binding protein